MQAHTRARTGALATYPPNQTRMTWTLQPSCQRHQNKRLAKIGAKMEKEKK